MRVGGVWESGYGGVGAGVGMNVGAGVGKACVCQCAWGPAAAPPGCPGRSTAAPLGFAAARGSSRCSGRAGVGNPPRPSGAYFPLQLWERSTEASSPHSQSTLSFFSRADTRCGPLRRGRLCPQLPNKPRDRARGHPRPGRAPSRSARLGGSRSRAARPGKGVFCDGCPSGAHPLLQTARL